MAQATGCAIGFSPSNLQQNGTSSRLRDVHRVGDCDTDLCLLQRGRVVDTVSSHADHKLLLLKLLHNEVLILWKHLRESRKRLHWRKLKYRSDFACFDGPYGANKTLLAPREKYR